MMFAWCLQEGRRCHWSWGEFEGIGHWSLVSEVFKQLVVYVDIVSYNDRKSRTIKLERVDKRVVGRW